MKDAALNDLIDRTVDFLRTDPTMAYMVQMEAELHGCTRLQIERRTALGVVTLAEMLMRTDIPECQWEEAVQQAGPLAARWFSRQERIGQKAAA